jgi:hypothetical protein
MTAYFTTLSGGKRRWSSTVRQILPIRPSRWIRPARAAAARPGRQSGSGVVLYTVLLDVDNADNALMAEMTTQCSSSPTGQPDCAPPPHCRARRRRPGRGGRGQRQHPATRGAHRPQRSPAVQMLDGLTKAITC